ncbi:hypothetical protein NDU88_012450 [Pleurodeles waltl]|uniref:Uncharacterized protein n=1 Tax=Pleurodeles waltl TaxID=8319 RepID=A0AAV7R1Z0_PLEWA|nr:hypothetical protein NDU88_012450 [Pleurodeles waltl]
MKPLRQYAKELLTRQILGVRRRLDAASETWMPRFIPEASGLLLLARDSALIRPRWLPFGSQGASCALPVLQHHTTDRLQRPGPRLRHITTLETLPGGSEYKSNAAVPASRERAQ